MYAEIGKDQTCGAAKKRKKDALRHHLPDKAATRSAQRRANGDFALTCGGARKLQTGEIHASNQQDQTHRGEQHKQLRSHISDNRIAQRKQAAVKIGIFFGIVECKPPIDVLHLALRLGDGDLRLQTKISAEKMDSAKLGSNRIAHSQWHQGIHRPARQPELLWQNTDDCVGVPTQLDGLAEDCRVRAERAPPESVREHHQAWTPVTVFIKREKAAEGGLETECAEKVGVAMTGGDLHRFSFSSKVERLNNHPADGSERTALLLDVFQIRQRLI